MKTYAGEEVTGVQLWSEWLDELGDLYDERHGTGARSRMIDSTSDQLLDCYINALDVIEAYDIVEGAKDNL